MSTDFKTRCSILSDIWISYKNDEAFEDFIYCNDLGLPIACALNSRLVNTTWDAMDLVNETFDSLLELTGKKDTGFENLNQLLEDAPTSNEDGKDV